MLNKFYADNFRCLVNFEFRPAATSLLVGRNGSGKTTVLEGLRLVRDFVAGLGNVKSIFSFSKTLWESRPKQRFELEVAGEAGETYLYVLEVDHSNPASPRLRHEELTLRGNRLFWFDDGRVQLFDDQHAPRGENFEFSTETSALASFTARGSHMERFQASVRGILFFSLDPRRMEGATTQEARWLSVDGSNLPSWLRTVSQEIPQAFLELTQSLKDVVTGFEQLRFREMGGSKILQIVMARQNRISFDAALPSLSDGERCLIALYAILHVYGREQQTLVFDEPDNFLALDEIKLWLHRLRDAVDESHLQVIVASHHPDIIDYLAADDVFILSRPSDDMVRIDPFRVDRSSGETASETLRLRLPASLELEK